MLYAFAGILLLGSVLLAAYAQWSVKGAVKKQRLVPSRAGLTGREVAEFVLRSGQVEGVLVEAAPPGELTDHYDPSARALRLSEAVYHGRDLAALGIAAHEAGHALQHRDRSTWLWMRGVAVPLAQWGGRLGFPFALLGASMRSLPLIGVGLALFGGVVFFQLLTLPVELDASKRAIRALRGSGLVETIEEEKGVRSVLSSAALTYVAAAVSSIAGLAQLVLRVFARRF